MLGSVHGAAGSAQVSSIAVGTRAPWLMPPKTLTSELGVQVSPSAGLKRRNVLVPSMAGDCHVGLEREVANADGVAISDERGRLPALREAGTSGVVGHARDELMRHGRQRALQRQLKRGTPGMGARIGENVERFVGLFRWRVVAVDIAVDAARGQPPIVGVGGKHRVGGKGVLPVGVDERETILSRIGPGVGLLRIVQHGYRKRLRPLEVVVGKRQG